MANERLYTTNRQSIVRALCTQLKEIDGSGHFYTDLMGRVYPRFHFWDEVQEWPSVYVNAGSERRQYQGGGYKDRFLTLTLRCYVNQENAADALDGLLEDVETVIEQNSSLIYTDKLGATQRTHQITVVSIDTDEGVLEPLGVGEILLEVHY